MQISPSDAVSTYWIKEEVAFYDTGKYRWDGVRCLSHTVPEEALLPPPNEPTDITKMSLFSGLPALDRAHVDFRDLRAKFPPSLVAMAAAAGLPLPPAPRYLPSAFWAAGAAGRTSTLNLLLQSDARPETVAAALRGAVYGGDFGTAHLLLARGAAPAPMHTRAGLEGYRTMARLGLPMEPAAYATVRAEDVPALIALGAPTEGAAAQCFRRSKYNNMIALYDAGVPCREGDFQGIRQISTGEEDSIYYIRRLYDFDFVVKTVPVDRLEELMSLPKARGHCQAAVTRLLQSEHLRAAERVLRAHGLAPKDLGPLRLYRGTPAAFEWALNAGASIAPENYLSGPVAWLWERGVPVPRWFYIEMFKNLCKDPLRQLKALGCPHGKTDVLGYRTRSEVHERLFEELFGQP